MAHEFLLDGSGPFRIIVLLAMNAMEFVGRVSTLAAVAWGTIHCSFSPASPLAGLPSPPGPHVATIQAMGGNQWLALGAARPDPVWGTARGRAYSPKMAFAPDLRSAFFYGEGVHGYIKPDGHAMDDMWFYDINAHAWICCYPGTPTNDAQLTLSPEGFWTNALEEPIPVTIMHGYDSLTYDTHLRKFVSMHVDSYYTRPKINGLRNPGGYAEASTAHPWFCDVESGRWKRRLMNGTGPTAGYGHCLIYVSSLRKYWYRREDARVYFFDYAANTWTTTIPTGPPPPFGIEAQAVYDPKREVIYLVGSQYPPAPDTNSLWRYDIQLGQWVSLLAANTRLQRFTSAQAVVNYDTVNDVLIVFHFGTDTVEVYDPVTNSWNTEVIPFPPGIHLQYRVFSGFYDPLLNIHVFVRAGDSSSSNTDILVYRFRRGPPQGTTFFLR
ncbi:MAG: hypothetical protein ACUVWX_08235 [Kiritimatiellia bacterium]